MSFPSGLKKEILCGSNRIRGWSTEWMVGWVDGSNVSSRGRYFYRIRGEERRATATTDWNWWWMTVRMERQCLKRSTNNGSGGDDDDDEDDDRDITALFIRDRI